MINMCNADPARLSTTTLARFRQAVHSGGLGTITLARQHKRPADNGLYMVDKEFHYIINEFNKFHLTRLDFLSLQKDTYIPIQFFINNFSTYNNKKIQRYYSLQH